MAPGACFTAAQGKGTRKRSFYFEDLLTTATALSNIEARSGKEVGIVVMYSKLSRGISS